ncbi:hypothetical protein V6N00_13950 [Tersicoccus sp. MR15.9]|uniref:hypothetical protein n=1 Tax=Tersicoccus mangrovi TaxID=3121635 RepID=UPI002FE5CA05
MHPLIHPARDIAGLLSISPMPTVLNPMWLAIGITVIVLVAIPVPSVIAAIRWAVRRLRVRHARTQLPLTAQLPAVEPAAPRTLAMPVTTPADEAGPDRQEAA